MLHRRAFLVALLGAVLLVAMIGTAGASGTKHRAVVVSPAAGGPHTRFTVTFRTPAAAGSTGLQRSTYQISASTHAASGCRSSVSHTITYAAKNQKEHVRLGPGNSGRLCAGTYKGSVVLIRTPMCGPPTMACPAYAAPGQRIGTFRFRVK